MKIQIKRFLFLVLLTTIIFTNINCQKVSNYYNSNIPYGIRNINQWTHVQNQWAKRNQIATIEYKDGSTISGQLISINESGLYIWDDPLSIFNPLRLKNHTQFVNFDSIGLIKVRELFLLDPIVRQVFNQGENPDIAAISQYAFFPDKLPECLREGNEELLADENAEQNISASEILSLSPNISRVFSQKKFTVFFDGLITAYMNEGASYNLGCAYNFNYLQSLQYQFGERPRINYSWITFPDPEKWGDGQYYSNIQSHTINYAFKLINRGELISRNFEVYLSAGPSLNKISTEYSANINYYDTVTFEYFYSNLVVEENKDLLFGFDLSLGANYYFIPNISLHIAFGPNYITSKTVKSSSVLLPETNETIFIPKQELSFSGWNFAYGIQFHF